MLDLMPMSMVVDALEQVVGQRPAKIKQGVVVQTSPLLVQLDNDIDTQGAPIPSPATTVVGALSVGVRVVCVEQHRRVMVIAVDTPAFPSVQTAKGDTTATVTADVSVWANVPGAATLGVIVDRPLLVRADFTGTLYTSSGTVMLGCRVGGARVIRPDYDDMNLVQDYSCAPMVQSTTPISVAGSRTLVVPAGTTTFALQGLRSAGTARTYYTRLTVTPLRWEG